MGRAFSLLFTILVKGIQSFTKSKQDLILENISLRQQLPVYVLKKTKPKITGIDRTFWVTLRNMWSNWSKSLVIVKPETVFKWQKRRFKKYWKNISNKDKKIRGQK